MQGIKPYVYPSISMANIQFGKHQYLILTNSGNKTVEVEVIGFPSNCVKTLDIREDSYYGNDGKISPLLQPMEVKLYRFEGI